MVEEAVLVAVVAEWAVEEEAMAVVEAVLEAAEVFL